MGFSDKCISYMTMCITSVDYLLVLFNGDKIEYIFFLKRLKWNILLNQSVLPNTRCTEEETAMSIQYLKGEPKRQETKNYKKETTISLCPAWWTN